MYKVNKAILDAYLDPLIALADDDEAVEKYCTISTEVEYREIIRTQLLPNYFRYDNDTQRRLKITLSYYLSNNKFDFNRVFYSSLPPFNLKFDARIFFEWIWEELFTGEDYYVNTECYEEIDDPYEWQGLRKIR